MCTEGLGEGFGEIAEDRKSVDERKSGVGERGAMEKLPEEFAGALLGADGFLEAGVPESGEVWRPVITGIVGFEEERDDFAGGADGPGDSFAGEGFDIAAGVADGEDTVPPHRGAATGEKAGATEAGIFQERGGFVSEAGENVGDGGGGAAGMFAGVGVEGCGEVEASVGIAGGADVTGFSDVHPNGGGMGESVGEGGVVEGGGSAEPGVGSDAPLSPRLEIEGSAGDAVAGEDDARVEEGGLTGNGDFELAYGMGRVRQEERGCGGEEVSASVDGFSDEMGIELVAGYGDAGGE